MSKSTLRRLGATMKDDDAMEFLADYFPCVANLKEENEALREWMGEDKLAEMSVAQEFRRSEEEKMKLSERLIATIGKGSFFDDDVIQKVQQLEAENDALKRENEGVREACEFYRQIHAREWTLDDPAMDDALQAAHQGILVALLTAEEEDDG